MSDKFFKYWFMFVAFLALSGVIGTFVITILVGRAAYDIGSEVNSEGGKAVIERLWCGQKGCGQ